MICRLKFLAPPPRTKIWKFDRFQPVIRKSYRFSRALKLVVVSFKGCAGEFWKANEWVAQKHGTQDGVWDAVCSLFTGLLKSSKAGEWNHPKMVKVYEDYFPCWIGLAFYFCKPRLTNYRCWALVCLFPCIGSQTSLGLSWRLLLAMVRIMKEKTTNFPCVIFSHFPRIQVFWCSTWFLAFLCFVKNIGELIDIFKIISIVSGYNKFVAAMLIIENAVFLVCFIFRYNFD